MTPRTKMLVAGVAVLWVAGPARYGFYSRQHDCTNGRYRFGGSCRECSDTPCPIGQYRVKCTGGSDSYCARCTNNCLKFNDQPGTDAMPKAACLEDSLSPVNLTTSPKACDPNKQPLTCAYTSEGSTEKMAGESLCQIETCCKECESEEEAVERGFGTVCPGSVPTSGTSTHADVAFNLETPGCLGDFNANAPKYKAAIAGLAGYSAGKVDFEWADGIENAGGDETLKCLSGDQRRRSSVPLPSAGVASDGGEVAGGQRREGCAPVEKLPKKDASVLFAVRIKDVPASDIEATWSALTEDAINRVLAEKCLHPVRMSQNVEGEPQEEDNPVATIVGAGVLVISGAAVFLICKFCCGVSSVAAGGGSVWDNVDWDSMPVCVCLCVRLVPCLSEPAPVSDPQSMCVQMRVVCAHARHAHARKHARTHARTHAHARTHNAGTVPAALGGAGLGPQSVAERGGACEQQVWQCVVVTWKGMRAHSKYRLTRKHTRGVCTQFGMASTHSAATRIGEGVGIPPRSYVLSARMCECAERRTKS